MAWPVSQRLKASFVLTRRSDVGMAHATRARYPRIVRWTAVLSVPRMKLNAMATRFKNAMSAVSGRNRACPSATRCAELAEGARCLQPTCGNGRVDGDDQCEPESSNDPNCDPNCRFPACGNGHVGLDENGMPEECDDGNEENTDACTNACRNASCGDGYEFEGVEECDDGNRVDTDTCTNDCTTPYCGDGIEQADLSEECDDGSDLNSETGACLPNCIENICGDGFAQEGVEACDEGMNNTNTGACLQSCQVASCGDGFRREDILSPGLDGFEYCDDDDEDEFNGCNSSCEQTEVEPNDDFGDDANTILFDRIVGVMEAGQGDRSPGVDTYEFQLNWGYSLDRIVHRVAMSPELHPHDTAKLVRCGPHRWTT